MATGLTAIEREDWIGRIDSLLPQTQCGQCGFPGCRPYASALVDGLADIDQCPPGGDAGAARLALLLGRSPKPVNRVHGEPRASPAVALIDEGRCIGCTLCIQACPVDAILGANQLMHTVITALCTGCELCLPPCPVDCITIEPAPCAAPDPDANRQRFWTREQRLERERRAQADARARKKAAATRSLPDPVAAALLRARTRLPHTLRRQREARGEDRQSPTDYSSRETP